MSVEKSSSINIEFSVLESESLNLKTGRCNHDFFDPKELYNLIVEHDYDLCRLKVPAENEFVPHYLHQTGLPFFFSGSIRKYRTRISDYPTVHYNYPNLNFEQYNGSQDMLLRDMLVDTWGQYPIGYYRSPLLSRLITKEQELECLYQFYKKYNLNKDYPNSQILFMKDGDKYVGVFTLNIVGNTLECNLAGILSSYRREKYFLDEMNYKKEFCLKHNIEYFTFGARNENAHVQQIFQHLNFQTVGNDNVFHIVPLLTYSKPAPIIKKIKNYAADNISLYKQLFIETYLHIQDKLNVSSNITFQLNNERVLFQNKSNNMRFSFPIVSANEVLIVLRCENENAAAFTGYMRACTN